jgi:hypothetical protein
MLVRFRKLREEGGLAFFFEEIQNGAIWGHCKVSYNIESSTILMTLIDKNFVATIYEAYQADIYLSLEDFRREVARWRTHWVITKRNDLPATLCTTLDFVNRVLYPSSGIFF